MSDENQHPITTAIPTLLLLLHPQHPRTLSMETCTYTPRIDSICGEIVGSDRSGALRGLQRRPGAACGLSSTAHGRESSGGPDETHRPADSRPLHVSTPFSLNLREAASFKTQIIFALQTFPTLIQVLASLKRTNLCFMLIRSPM